MGGRGGGGSSQKKTAIHILALPAILIQVTSKNNHSKFTISTISTNTADTLRSTVLNPKQRIDVATNSIVQSQMTENTLNSWHWFLTVCQTSCLPWFHRGTTTNRQKFGMRSWKFHNLSNYAHNLSNFCNLVAIHFYDTGRSVIP